MQSFVCNDDLRSAIAQRLAEFPVRRADSSDLRVAAVAVGQPVRSGLDR